MPLKHLRKIKNFILDLLFPKFCFGCGKESDYLCKQCALKLRFFNYLSCPVCKLKTENGAICKNCRKKSKIDRLISVVHFDDPIIKSIIHEFKYKNAKTLALILSQIFIDFVTVNGYLKITEKEKRDFVITAVPLHRKRFRRRGFNQAELIADELSKKLGIEICKNALKRIKDNPPQVEAENREQRIKNVIGIFKVKKPEKVNGKIILLVDDVTTTGSTLNECAKILKSAGAKKVWGLTIARG